MHIAAKCETKSTCLSILAADEQMWSKYKDTILYRAFILLLNFGLLGDMKKSPRTRDESYNTAATPSLIKAEEKRPAASIWRHTCSAPSLPA